MLALITYILTMVTYTSTARRIFRSVYHDGRPWSASKGFWVGGQWRLILLLVIPVVYFHLVNYLAFGPFQPNWDTPRVTDMVVLPVVALGLFPMVLWAARALRSLGFIGRFRPAGPTAA